MGTNSPHQQLNDTASPSTSRRETQNDDVGGENEDEEEDEEKEIEKLETQVKEMGEKLRAYRSSFPNQLQSTLSTVLSSQQQLRQLRQRTPLSLLHSHGSHPSSSSSGAESSHANSSRASSLVDDEETPHDIDLLEDKIRSNISAMPAVLKRMHSCISRIDKHVSSETIHPPFSRKKS